MKNPDVLEKVTSGNCLNLYEKIFTSPTIDPVNNWENCELLGDVVSNAAIVMILYQKFPQLRHPLGFKVMARLKILYVSKKIFHQFSDKLGFIPYIKVDPALMENRLKVLTDVFEAFIGATQLIFDSNFDTGVGYAVVYAIISSLLNEMPISLKYNDLYDSVTRVKELFEYREFKNKLGPYLYEYQRNDSGVVCHVINKGKVIGVGQGMSQSAAQQRAAEEALKTMGRLGFKKAIAEPWLSMKL